MAKKPKEADTNDTSNSNSNGDSNSGSDSSNIFKTLFGDVPVQLKSPLSIFSHANPFRRKPQKQQQSGIGLGSAEVVEKSMNDESIIVDTKKRNRIEEKLCLDMGTIDDEDSGIRLEIKKSKRDKFRSSEFGGGCEEKIEEENPVLGSTSKRGKGKEHTSGSESKEFSESGKDPNFGFKLKEMPKQWEEKNQDTGMTEKKRKKKRKRDEVEAEAEYEEMPYGVVKEGGETGLGGPVVGEKRKKFDDPREMMMVSKEGFDGEGKLLRTVFVGNLPLKVKKKALFKEFSHFGEIESVRIRSVPLLDAKKPRKVGIIQKKISGAVDSVHAYIVFQKEQAAQASLAHNMASVGGNHVRVDRACPPRKKLKGENAPLYDNKRTVFVGNLPFDVKGSANMVVEKLRDRELRLYHPVSNLTPSKRKNPSPGEREHFPTKKLAVDLRTPESCNKVKTKSASSYQGQQASKFGALEQAGKKRKLDRQTPESYLSNKKTRKLRQD